MVLRLEDGIMILKIYVLMGFITPASVAIVDL